MKRALIIAAGCALLAGPALAQSPPPGPDRDGDRMERRDVGWDRDWRGGWRRDDRDRDDEPRDLAEGWRGAWSRHHGHRRGAGFFLQSGDTRLAVRLKNERCGPAWAGHDSAGQGALTAHLRGNRDTSGKLQRRRTRDATHQF